MSTSHLDLVTRSLERIRTKRSILCVGLDPQLELLPSSLVKEFLARKKPDDWKAIADLLVVFNRSIIDAVSPFAVWVKLNIAFYECYGSQGLRAYEETIAYARSKDLLIICDGKRGDGGDTAATYAKGHLGSVAAWNDERVAFEHVPGPLRVDALTIETTIGNACFDHYVNTASLEGTTPIVVTKTSFKPTSSIEQITTTDGTLVWEEFARMVDRMGQTLSPSHAWKHVWAVVGATFPEEARRARELMPHTWFLVPGYGAQGGSADGAVIAADENGLGVTVNSSRAIIFAENATQAAEVARDDLNAALKRAGKGRGIFWD